MKCNIAQTLKYNIAQTLSLAPLSSSLALADAANNEANYGLPTTTTSTPIIDLVLSFNTQQFNNARNQTR